MTTDKIKSYLNILIGIGFFAFVYTFMPAWNRHCFGICYSSGDINTHLKIASGITATGVVLRLLADLLPSKK